MLYYVFATASVEMSSKSLVTVNRSLLKAFKFLEEAKYDEARLVWKDCFPASDWWGDLNDAITILARDLIKYEVEWEEICTSVETNVNCLCKTNYKSRKCTVNKA